VDIKKLKTYNIKPTDKNRKKKKKKPKIRVPKIPFVEDLDDEENENEQQITWIDLHTYLFMEGYLFLGQDLTAEIANKIIGVIICMANEADASDELSFYINCSRGSTKAAMCLFDVMQGVPTVVNTIGTGMVGSVGALVLLGGELRRAYPHTRVMLYHPPAKLKDAPTKDFLRAAHRELIRRDQIINIFVEKTGQPFNIIKEDITNMRFMSAKEAQNYGIIHELFVELDFTLDVNDQKKNGEKDNGEKDNGEEDNVEEDSSNEKYNFFSREEDQFE
jgi:ATP-dependent Clp protease protease subunit